MCGVGEGTGGTYALELAGVSGRDGGAVAAADVLLAGRARAGTAGATAGATAGVAGRGGVAEREEAAVGAEQEIVEAGVHGEHDDDDGP